MIRKIDFHELSTLKYIYSILYQLDNTDRVNIVHNFKSFEEFLTYSDGVYIHIDDAYEKAELPKINGLICIKRDNPSNDYAMYSIDILYIASWANSGDKYKVLYELINTAIYDKKDLPIFIWLSKPVKPEFEIVLNACNFKIKYECLNACVYYRFVE